MVSSRNSTFTKKIKKAHQNGLNKMRILIQKLFLGLNIFLPQYNNEKSKKHVSAPATIISKFFLTTRQTKMVKMFANFTVKTMV